MFNIQHINLVRLSTGGRDKPSCSGSSSFNKVPNMTSRCFCVMLAIAGCVLLGAWLSYIVSALEGKKKVCKQNERKDLVGCWVHVCNMHLAVPRSLIARVLNAKATIERSANGKRDFVTLDQVCRLLFARKSVNSRQFYPKIVLSCFYLFMINISYFKKYSIWIPRLPFAVNTIRNLTVSKPWTRAS